jgi:hypothetical protein
LVDGEPIVLSDVEKRALHFHPVGVDRCGIAPQRGCRSEGARRYKEDDNADASDDSPGGSKCRRIGVEIWRTGSARHEGFRTSKTNAEAGRPQLSWIERPSKPGVARLNPRL